MKTSRETIERLRELEKQLPPAPWTWRRNGIDYGYVDARGGRTLLHGEFCEGAVEEDDPQGIALSEARNALPSLLADAERCGKLEEALPLAHAQIFDGNIRGADTTIAAALKESP